MKKKSHKLLGGILIVIFFILASNEIEKIAHPFTNLELTEKYVDYSVLIYISSWLIQVLLFFTGVAILFKWRKTSLFLLIFSLSSLLEVFVNETFYIVKSIEGFLICAYLCIAILFLITICLNLFKIKRIGFNDLILSIILAVVIVYLPNALITFYF